MDLDSIDGTAALWGGILWIIILIMMWHPSFNLFKGESSTTGIRIVFSAVMLPIAYFIVLWKKNN